MFVLANHNTARRTKFFSSIKKCFEADFSELALAQGDMVSMSDFDIVFGYEEDEPQRTPKDNQCQ